MKIFLLICIMSVLCSQNIHANLTKDDFKEFKSEKGGFSVLLPGKPAEKIIPRQTKEGVINYTQYIIETDDMDYLVSFTPLNLSQDKRKDLTEEKMGKLREFYFSRAKMGLQRQVGKLGNIVEEKDLLLGKFPAKKVKVELKPGIICIGEYTLTYSNSYIVTAVIKNNNEQNNKKAELFLNSFKLLNQ